ncbi:MAG: transglycosylase SLT domain-containing protein [Candidatus Woesebacteria bacterium]|nr:MAG: transglycosylase SLT domain-containing protein [Candidatus Woesebacteria bacterium]
MKIFTWFLVGFAVGFFSFSIFLNSKKQEKKTVLAAYIQASSTPIPTDSPNPTPTESPTPAPTPFPEAPAPTPTIPPAPTPTPDVWSPPAISPVIQRYAQVYNVDSNLLERIANCESHFNPNAQNGDYLGMFQFSTNTWISTRNQMAFDANPILRTNIEESIRTAAYLVSKRGTEPWPLCLR